MYSTAPADWAKKYNWKITLNFSLIIFSSETILTKESDIYQSVFLLKSKLKLNLKTGCWLIGFYGISTFVGYLMSNPFLYKGSVLFQTIQFSISQKHFYFKLFNLFKQF